MRYIAIYDAHMSTDLYRHTPSISSARAVIPSFRHLGSGMKKRWRRHSRHAGGPNVRWRAFVLYDKLTISHAKRPGPVTTRPCMAHAPNAEHVPYCTRRWRQRQTNGAGGQSRPIPMGFPPSAVSKDTCSRHARHALQPPSQLKGTDRFFI